MSIIMVKNIDKIDKIDKIDQRILYELDQNCRLSDNQLAKIVRRSREAVRHRIKRLQQQEIIAGFRAAINPSKFGMMMFKLYFQLANVPAERKRFHEYFRRLPEIYWFGESDGAWDFHATLYAQSISEFNSLKNKIFTDFKDIIITRDVGVLVQVRNYPVRFLVPELQGHPQPITYAGELVFNALDELDKKILSILSYQARIPLVQLAKKCQSTVDIIRNRMRKLERKGIIERYRAVINYNKLGYEYFKAFIYFDNLSELAERKLVQYVHQHSNIQFLIFQLSSWDAELEIVAKNYHEFTSIMDNIRKEFVQQIHHYDFCLLREDVWYLGEKQGK